MGIRNTYPSALKDREKLYEDCAGKTDEDISLACGNLQFSGINRKCQ